MNHLNYFERRDKIYELFGKDIYQRYPLSLRILNRFIRSKIHYGNRETEQIKEEYQHNWKFENLIKNSIYYLLYLLNLTLFRFWRNNQEKILVSSSIFGRFEILGEQLKDKHNICVPLTKKGAHLVLKSKVRDSIDIDRIIYNKRLQRLLPETAAFISKFIDNNQEFNKEYCFKNWIF